jgi:hypothetical protein
MSNVMKSLFQRIKGQIIREVPPELYACEICRKSECSQDEWLACENRIMHAKCAEALQGKKRP